MKKLLLTCILSIIAITGFAKDINTLISSGNKVFIEVVDKRENIENEEKIFLNYLNDRGEWGRWDIVDSKADADFTCRLTLEKKGPGFSISYGARVFAIIDILDNNNESIWSSKSYTGHSNEFTGFNALGDAVRKIVRRAIKQELYNEK